MNDLDKHNAKLCLTAGGVLIYKNKVLLVKHKKLGIWLAPGGHVEKNELPHKAAEREFLEETGIKVTTSTALPLIQGTESDYIPVPFVMNHHWISKANYHQRLNSQTPHKRISTSLWPLGCEQHYTLVYLVNPEGSVDFRQNVEETDGIAWFTQDQITGLDTPSDIKAEIAQAFKLTTHSRT